MENSIYAGLTGRGLLKLLKDFTKGCISENTEAKAEFKPLAKSLKGPESMINELKYSKSNLK